MADAVVRPQSVVARNTITIVTASVAMFMLGAVYAYGVLLPALMAEFGWARAEAALPQAVLLFVYAVGMALGGALQDRASPSGGAMFGGVLFGGGLLLASAVPSLGGLVGAYGILSGVGFGFMYIACVTAAMRSFPGRRGLAAGTVVGAFGLGAFVWAPLAQAGLPELGWDGVMRAFGMLCFVLLPLLGVFVRAPHPLHLPHGGRGATLAGALRTRLFWTVFTAYTLVTAVGLLLLAHVVTAAIARGTTPATAAWLLSASAIGSGSGRVLMGWLSDRWGRLPCLIGASLAAAMLLAMLAFAREPTAIFLLTGGTGFAFGAWLALYGPTSTDLFGLRAAGAIYGALYLSYGIGGLLGPTLGGALADATGNYRLAFLVAAGLALLGAGLFTLAAGMHPPRYPHPPALEEELPLDE